MSQPSSHGIIISEASAAHLIVSGIGDISALRLSHRGMRLALKTM
jgi:hypothetical protein